VQTLVVACATEWSGGGVIDLGGRPASIANAINDAGQAVGAIIGEGGFLALNGAAAASSIWDACLATTKRPGQERAISPISNLPFAEVHNTGIFPSNFSPVRVGEVLFECPRRHATCFAVGEGEVRTWLPRRRPSP
jgi:hypothetical protein